MPARAAGTAAHAGRPVVRETAPGIKGRPWRGPAAQASSQRTQANVSSASGLMLIGRAEVPPESAACQGRERCVSCTACQIREQATLN